MMWIILMLAMALITIGLLFYLSTRIAKFSWIRKLSGEGKKRKYLISAVAVFVLTAVLVFLLDLINASVVIIYLGLFWLLCDGAAYLIRKIFPGKAKKKYHYYAGGAAILITILHFVCGWYLAHYVWVTPYTIETEKKVGDLRIVQFADSHLGTTFHGEGFAQQIRRIQDQNPDVVLITGDYVDDDSVREDMIACCEALGTLRTTYGVYFSFGNHDKGYYGSEHRGFSAEDLTLELEKNGVRILQDETIPIGDWFYIIGRQDRSEEQRGSSRASMEALTADLDPDRFSIVMDHQPNDYAAQEATGVDLVLSGHTHGGQLFPINHVGEWIGANDRTYGRETRGTTNYIVTSGISDWALKFKTGCKSEFVVIDIVTVHVP